MWDVRRCGEGELRRCGGEEVQDAEEMQGEEVWETAAESWLGWLVRSRAPVRNAQEQF